MKFKPKLIIEEVDTEPEHGELLFLEDEPEFREISYDDEDMTVPRNEINQDNAEKNLINHRKDALKDSEARNIAIKMALDDTKSQDYLVNIINQGLLSTNQQENENIIDDEIEDNEMNEMD